MGRGFFTLSASERKNRPAQRLNYPAKYQKQAQICLIFRLLSTSLGLKSALDRNRGDLGAVAVVVDVGIHPYGH